MRVVDELLEDDELLDSVFEAQGQRHPHSRTRGRKQTPAEVTLRMLILKHMRNWSYEVLEREVRANVVDGSPVFSPGRDCGAQSLKGWNAGMGHLVASAFLQFSPLAYREWTRSLWDATPNQPVVVGLDKDVRSFLTTRTLDAEPDGRDEFPTPSIWPFPAAVATSIAFIGSIFTPWGITIGAIPVAITLIGWFWPQRKAAERRRAREIWQSE